MKKLFLLALIAIATACSKNDEFATSDIELTLSVDKVTNVQLKGNDVERNNIPVYIKSVTGAITGGSVDVLEQFNLVEDGSGTQNFMFTDIPLNSTMLSITTEPTNTTEYNLFTKLDMAIEDVPVDNADGISVPAIFGLTGIDALPYVTYYGSSNLKLNPNATNNINLTVNPEQGRDMGVFTNNSSYEIQIDWKLLSEDVYRTLTLQPGEVCGYYITMSDWGMVPEAYNDASICDEGNTAHLIVTWYTEDGLVANKYEKTRNSHFLIPCIGWSEYCKFDLTDEGITVDQIPTELTFTPVTEETWELKVNDWI